MTSSFALTLVPIALAYDLAHNYTYLVIEGRRSSRLSPIPSPRVGVCCRCRTISPTSR